MRLLTTFIACVAVFGQTQRVEQRLRQAQDMLGRAEAALARGVLEGAAALCDNSTDGVCAETYAWLGIVMESQDYGNVNTLRERVEPLYAKALSRAGGNPTALLLELDGHALLKTGQPERGGALLGQAAALRRTAVESMSPQSIATGDARMTGGGVLPPQLRSRVEPSYSDAARLLRQQGTVMLRLVVDTDGKARDIRLVRSLGFGLDEQAASAMESWVFAPGTKDGQPVKVVAQVSVNFRLL